jgi:NAD(P)-dependent dehydrogenase (short-subunit alcohol dehydrogenase family)
MTDTLFDIRGRVIVVTGASSGIGHSLARALGARGGRVACIARRRDRLDALVDGIAKAGGEAIAITCDVTDQASVRAMVDTTERKLGPIDVLLNNAGISLPRPVLEIPLQEWDQVLATNLGAAFAVAQEVAKRMATRGRGSIINISSIAAYRSFALAPAYGAAKAGLNNLTETMAVALAEKGIRVNGIAPGSFDSELGDNYAKRHPEHRARGLERVPMRRAGDHQELVGPVVLLASDASTYMTGTTLIVDGGATVAR